MIHVCWMHWSFNLTRCRPLESRIHRLSNLPHQWERLPLAHFLTQPTLHCHLCARLVRHPPFDHWRRQKQTARFQDWLTIICQTLLARRSSMSSRTTARGFPLGEYTVLLPMSRHHVLYASTAHMPKHTSKLIGSQQPMWPRVCHCCLWVFFMHYESIPGREIIKHIEVLSWLQNIINISPPRRKIPNPKSSPHHHLPENHILDCGTRHCFLESFPVGFRCHHLKFSASVSLISTYIAQCPVIPRSNI